MNEFEEALVQSLNRLGLDDADTDLGALENLAAETKWGSERIAEGLHDVAEAIREVGRRLR